jgi:DNA-binding CsgD family transcriptional regulator
MVVGREQERARLSELLAGAAEGQAGALLVVGEAGIGKTALLGEAVALSEERATRVLELRCVESEAATEGVGIGELTRALAGSVDGLPEGQRRALRALVGAEPAAATADRYLTAAALLGLFGEAAGAGPLLVAIDDAHWLDELSATAIAFAARRLEAEPIALVATMRPGLDGALERAGLPRLGLAGLGVDECARLLDGEMAPDAARALARETGGNPLWLTEIAATLGPDERAGLAPISIPQPLPAFERAFGRRLEALDPGARSAALLAAAGAGDEADEVLAALGEERPALERAETSGLVELDGRHLRFAHPVLRSLAYHGSAPAERRAAHAALAAVCADPIRAAWHGAAAAAGPDAEAAAALEAAATAARARLAVGGVAAALERSAELTPGSDPEGRRRRLGAAALEHHAAGRQERALALLGEALDGETGAAQRARLQMARADTLYWLGRSAEALSLLDAEVALIGAEEPALAFELRLFASIGAFPAHRAAEAEERAAALVADTPAPIPNLIASVWLDQLRLMRGHPPSRAEAVDRRTQLWKQAQGALPPQLFLQLLAGDMWDGDLELSLERVDAFDAMLREAGALTGLPYLLTARSELHFRLGRPGPARADALAALDLHEATGQMATRGMGLAALARVDAMQGRQRPCRASLEAVAAIPPGPDLSRSAYTYAAHAEALLELGAGRLPAAIEALRRTRALTVEHDIGHPGVIPWQGDLAEALIRSGASGEAEAEVEELAKRAERCESASAAAAAARARGLLAEPAEVDDAFAAALREHERVPMPFERARTLLCCGERLRRLRRRVDAREPLAEALATFERLGAAPWAARAADELSATGAQRPAHPASNGETLTAQEFRVATALADGTTVREAAATLFLSPKTVEAHLSRVYRKLDVSTRADLRARLDNGDVATS